jgi:hypothetical protein
MRASHAGGRLREPIWPGAFRLLGVVRIIELDSKLSDVFAVERCDERAVERTEDAVGNLVAAMLQIAQQPDVPLPIRPIGDHPGEHLGHLGGVDAAPRTGRRIARHGAKPRQTIVLLAPQCITCASVVDAGEY